MIKFAALVILLLTSQSVFSQKKDSLVHRQRFDTVKYVVHFEKDKFDLTAEERIGLDDFLRSNWGLAKEVTYVKGHTDSDGTDEYNIELSKNRCYTVTDRISELELRFDSVVIDAYGETKLLKTENSEGDYASNRRVEISIVHSVWYDDWIPCAGVKFCNKKVVLPQGSFYWIDTCIFPDYDKCIKIAEFVVPDSARAASLNTMDDEGNLLRSGGMLEYDICDDVSVQVYIPIDTNCMSDEMSLYNMNNDGQWELIQGARPEVVRVQGVPYYSFPLSGNGIINCDQPMPRVPSPPKIVFKGKKGVKLSVVSISCDCPFTIQEETPKRTNRKKVKMTRLCCPELQVKVQATLRNGENVVLDYGDIDRLKPRRSLLACKEEEKWRWFIFRNRIKPVYRFYKVRPKDFN